MSKTYEQIIMARENGWTIRKSAAGTCAKTQLAGTLTGSDMDGKMTGLGYPYANAAGTNLAGTPVVIAGEIVLTDIDAYVDGNLNNLLVRAGTAIIFNERITSRQRYSRSFNTYLKVGAGTSLSVEVITGTSVHVNAQGYITY